MNEAHVSEKAGTQERIEPQRSAGQLAGSVEQPAKRLSDSDAVRLPAASEAARHSEQLAEQAAAVEALQTARRVAEEKSAGMAQTLSNAEAALKTRTAECAQAQEERRRLEAQLSELRTAAEKAMGAREGLEQTGAQTTEELRALRPKLDAEVHAHQLAQEKLGQLQQEMAGYRQALENPAALHAAERLLAKRVKELVAAEEQVRNLTEELRTVRAANVQQGERVDKLRWLAIELKKRYDARKASVRTLKQEQSRLQSELHEETVRRQAAEAEIARLRGEPASANPESEEIDADFIADLRKDVQAALKAAASNRRSATAPVKPSGIWKVKAGG